MQFWKETTTASHLQLKKRKKNKTVSFSFRSFFIKKFFPSIVETTVLEKII